MKKKVLLLALAAILFVLGACSTTKFDGTRTGNANQLMMEYKVLNKVDSQVLDLQAGDYLDFVITSESGNVNINVQKEGDDPIYNGIDVPTSSFDLAIEENGSYTVSVTGENARGSVSIVKRDHN